MNERKPTVRAALAILLVALGLITSGLPAQGTQASAPERTAPAQPPVVPPPSEAPKASPAPPSPAGPVPALPKAGEEIVDRRTEKSKTFATDTFGQFRTELYSERVHFKDAKGAYQAIDAELGASKDGVRRSKANAFVLELADDANAAAVARLRLDDQVSVGFALDGARGVKARADKAVSTYAGVSPGVDVRLTSRPDGLKEELVLASAAAGDRFLFPLELKGLTAAIDDVGDVVYRDKDGAERARTPHGFMTDSAVDPRSDEAPMSMGVTYALVPHARGTALEVRLDRAWLTDPARQWPIVVDPQLTVNTFADDTYVMSGFSRDNSSDLELKVGTYDGGAHIGRSYVRFDTAAIDRKVVNSAQLHIGERHSWNCASAWPSVHRVTAAWNGRDMRDWPGKPFDPNPAGGVISANGACAGRTVIYNVTSAAAHWAANAGSSHGLVLETNHSDNNAWKKFHSSETGIPPRLEVTWSEPPPPSTGNPYGYLDLVYPFVGGVLIQGWAIDPDTAAPIAVHVYNANFVEALVANASRPDVGAAFPGYGNNHGIYDFAPMSPGSHNVCVYAINVGAGTHTSIGCRSVVVPGRVNEPFGSLDGVNLTPGGAQVRGWAIDPDTLLPVDIQVWSDGGYITTMSANTYRPDVAPFGYGSYHGYDSFVALTPGYHNVCTAGVNIGAGSGNVLLGCRQVTVSPANPPAAPTNAVASMNADKSVNVAWTPSGSNGGSPIDYYAIYAYDAATATYVERYSVVYTAGCGQVCNRTTFTGLALDKSYYFAGYAHNGSPVNNGFSPAAISNTVAIPPPTTTTTTVPPTTTTGPSTTTTTVAPTTTTTAPTTTTTVPPTTTTTVVSPRPLPPTQVLADAGNAVAVVGWVPPDSPPSSLDFYDVTACPGGVVASRDCAGKRTVSVRSDVWDARFEDLTNGDVYTFAVVARGPGGISEVATSNAAFPRAPMTLGHQNAASAKGAGHTLVVNTDGTVSAWGLNGFGQLGDGTTTNNAEETQVQGLTNAIAVSAGERHSLALRSDGTVWAWGENSSGQLGRPGPSTTAPVRVPDLAGISAIAAGAYHSVALTTTGTVWVWGEGAQGQLGRAADGASDSPVPIVELSDIKNVAAAGSFTLALHSDGSVWGWGSNSAGQLGFPAGGIKTEATLISGLPPAKAVAAGKLHGIALSTDGSVSAWGANDWGQLADPSLSPGMVNVPGLNGISAIAAGERNSVVLQSDGTVWGWGANDFGQLGLGYSTNTPNPSPVQMLKTPIDGPTPITGVESITAGSNGVLVVVGGATWETGEHFAAPPDRCVLATRKSTSKTTRARVREITAVPDPRPTGRADRRPYAMAAQLQEDKLPSKDHTLGRPINQETPITRTQLIGAMKRIYDEGQADPHGKFYPWGNRGRADLATAIQSLTIKLKNFGPICDFKRNFLQSLWNIPGYEQFRLDLDNYVGCNLAS